MRTRDDTGAEVLGAMLLGWVLGWGSGAIRALVFMKGWEWFVSDSFDAPALGFIPAWGLVMLISFATVQVSNDNVNSTLGPIVRVVGSTITSLFLSAIYFLSFIILAGWR